MLIEQVVYLALAFGFGTLLTLVPLFIIGYLTTK